MEIYKVTENRGGGLSRDSYYVYRIQDGKEKTIGVAFEDIEDAQMMARAINEIYEEASK